MATGRKADSYIWQLAMINLQTLYVHERLKIYSIQRHVSILTKTNYCWSLTPSPIPMIAGLKQEKSLSGTGSGLINTFDEKLNARFLKIT